MDRPASQLLDDDHQVRWTNHETMIRTFLPRNRKSPRLEEFEYTERRWYFVTICTAHRQPFLGELLPDSVMLSDIGKIVEEEWQRTAELRDDVVLDEFVVMPDHFHALIALGHLYDVRGQSSLSMLIGQFKGAVTRRVRQLSPFHPAVIWQRSFHDSIVRNDSHFRKVKAYIAANPQAASARLLR
ncbi:MAG TPA: transposase [Gemmatimonadales bacterium]|nr:transposase [Gemmatimonadales bacterium]